MPKGHAAFTPEQAVWLKTLFPKYGGAETARMMNAWFGTSFTVEQIDAAAPGRRGSWLTPEVKAWLREHIHERSLAGTAEELYRVFGIRVRVGQLNSANSNHKLGRANRNVIRAYSEDEFDWLKENLPTAPRDEIADRFLERFGREISHSKLDNFVSRHGCQGAPNIGGFKKGHVSHNKGRKGWSAPGTEATRFKKGHINNVEHPMYTERWRIVGSQKARTLFIKVPGPDPYRRDFPKGPLQIPLGPQGRVGVGAGQRPCPEGARRRAARRGSGQLRAREPGLRAAGRARPAQRLPRAGLCRTRRQSGPGPHSADQGGDRNPMTTAYPLHWPAGLPRTKTKLQSRFQSTLHRALENVRAELRLFGKDSGKPVSDLILSSNVTLTEQRPADTGIAAYFKWDGLDCCIAVDRYPKVEHNVQAIAKVVEAERAKLRHGGLNVVRAAFRGYAALPPPRDGKPWWDVLGVPQDCRLDAARQAHRTLAVKHHPDAGGDVDRMAEVNRAWDEAQRALAG